MMSFTKLILASTSVMMLCACAPAAQQSAELNPGDVSSHSETHQTASSSEAKSKKDSHYRTTIKPGADVSMKSVLPKSMTSGVFQTVELEFSEGYQDGVMTVSIEPSDGLNLFGGTNSKTFNMSRSGSHSWDVDVKADSDGVYFLNVFAQANGMPRSFSVRIDMGVVTQKMFDDAMPAEGELTDGGKIRVLEANETIQ